MSYNIHYAQSWPALTLFVSFSFFLPPVDCCVASGCTTGTREVLWIEEMDPHLHGQIGRQSSSRVRCFWEHEELE